MALGRLSFVFGLALLEPKALAIRLEDVDVMREAVEERAREQLNFLRRQSQLSVVAGPRNHLYRTGRILTQGRGFLCVKLPYSRTIYGVPPRAYPSAQGAPRFFPATVAYGRACSLWMEPASKMGWKRSGGRRALR